MAFSPDAQTLASGSADKRVRFETRSNRQVRNPVPEFFATLIEQSICTLLSSQLLTGLSCKFFCLSSLLISNNFLHRWQLGLQ